MSLTILNIQPHSGVLPIVKDIFLSRCYCYDHIRHVYLHIYIYCVNTVIISKQIMVTSSLQYFLLVYDVVEN